VKRRYFVPQSGHVEERAFLVGVKLPDSKREDELENLRELEFLAKTAGARVVGRTIQNRTRIDGSTYIGEGKLEELAEEVYRKKVNLVIFDDDLSPAQARNVENRLKVNVIDRTELILDIFARRARTRQARIQVEIAQLTYALPRLRRLWDHLSRQAGGIGTRGPGETQLEVDRRKVRERIAHLHKELRRIDRRTLQRRKKRSELFNVTLVGYTNAGKSTMMNKLSGSSVVESSNLFSTLDSTTRRVKCCGETFLLTDTVGFIRKLPPHLVESFKATLRDVREADLLLHMVDVSNPYFEKQISVVNKVLSEVLEMEGGTGGRVDIPTLLVFNKVDLLPGGEVGKAMVAKYPDAVFTSATRGDGIEELMEKIGASIKEEMKNVRVEVSAGDGRLIARLEELSIVDKKELVDTKLIYSIHIRARDLNRLLKTESLNLLEG